MTDDEVKALQARHDELQKTVEKFLVRTSAFDATRETRYRVIDLRQQANGYTLRCDDRQTPFAPAPPLEIADTDMTAEEHEQAIACFAMLERVYERLHDKRLADASDPTILNARLVEMHAAEKRRAQAEADHAALDAEINAKRAELASLGKGKPA